MHSLPVFVRLAGRSVLVIGTGDVADAKRRLVERAGAVVSEDPLGVTQFAFVVADDPREAEAIAVTLKARGMLVNVADQPGLCDFTLPAIVDRDPVIIAIGTGGASAGLAKSLRQRLETILPQSLGLLAERLYTVRVSLSERWPTADARRRALDSALSQNGALDPLSEESPNRLEDWLTKGNERDGGIHTLTITSDDPDDLTLRAARLLGQADEVWHQPDIAPAILHRARADAKRVASMTAPADGSAKEGALILWLTRK